MKTIFTDSPVYDAYEIAENRPVADLNSQGLILKHKKTGARLTVLANDDENKVFYIAFRTPPADSTGVAHILEHSVLCGSKAFPLKDPFIELAKGSLNTFLNAMTFPDKTIYPVASCNHKDFANLMHVYLDAVFYPNIYQEEKIFQQEGWHYHLESPEEELQINGVVYNEMKGAYSTPDDVVDKAILQSLYPDTAYGCDSGGDPDIIPTLTNEQFLDFHRRYYHPSNSYIYLYGDMDLEERLEFLDKEYLSHFDALDIDSTIILQRRFDAPRYTEEQFSVMSEEDLKENTYLTYSVSMGLSTDPRHYLALQILDYALCSAPGAPLKQALLDKRIGKDVYSTLENGILQPFLSIIAKNAEEDQQEEFIRTIETVLAEQAAAGIDRKALAAGLNYFEFRYREADYGAYPKGLIMGMQALDSWLYEENSPFMHLEASRTFGELKEAVAAGYFEQMIRDYLLDNPHKSILKVVPAAGLTAANEARLKRELTAWQETLAPEEIDRIIREAEALEAYQEQEDAPEDLEKIPLLTRADMKKEAAGYINEVRESEGTTILFHEVFTNGIAYLRFMFDIRKVPEALFPYLGILKSALTRVDTEHYSFAGLYNEINIYTGGIETVINTYVNAADMSKYKATLEIKVKVLYENTAKAFELVRELVLHSRFQDTKRLYEIIAEMKSKLETAMSGSGHNLAVIRTLSYFSETAAIAEQLNGIPQYRLLVDLEENFEARKNDLTHKLEQLVTYLFQADNFMMDLTAAAEGYAGMEERTAAFRKELFQADIGEAPFIPVTARKNEGFMTAGQVQYVCVAGNFVSKGLPYTGALKVLKVLMGYDYLWNQVRVKGGAYGCMCGFTKTGDSYFVSYRDPNLERTIDVFKQAVDFIRNYQGDERAITQYIIGAISEMDTPMTPAARGTYSLSGYMTGYTIEDLQKSRDELLQVNREILRGLHRYVEAMLTEQCLCVVGNEDKIKGSKELFMEIMPLF